ncbi:MAG: carotenoid oxygenase family protein [Chloroflexi bacterium]|nr:MAG: carotenoid oxygenase family protein [Chloroflexota bacterium]
MPVNPYLEGRYAPVADELTVDTLEVVGTLPEELDGVYVRNGPNPRFAPPGRYHWFDGDGMLHFGDRLLALWYLTGAPYAVDPVSLSTLGVEDFDGTLRCDMSAHAKVLLPARVPIGFHACWMPGAAVSDN